MTEKLLSFQALAEWLDVPEETVRKWRVRGDGPPGIRVGRHVRFRPEDVRRWLDQRSSAA